MHMTSVNMSVQCLVIIIIIHVRMCTASWILDIRDTGFVFL